MNALIKIEDFSREEDSPHFVELIKIYYLLSRTRMHDLRKICDVMISKGLLDIFVKLWDDCHQNPTEFYGDVNSVKFNSLNKAKIIFWNFSDKCVSLAKACHQDGRIIDRLMREFAIPELAVPCLTQARIRHTMKATLGILHNVVRLYNRNRELIRKDDGIDKILAYEKSTYLIIKAKILIVLAYCINEDENWKIMTGKGVVDFILGLLRSALESSNHLAATYAFSAEEIVSALNKLASNDDNKKSFVDAGILPLLTQLLDPATSSPSEHLEAVNCIWSLAFHKENKDKIIEEPGLLDLVKNLRSKKGPGERLSRAVSSLLFVLNLEQPPDEVGVKQKTSVKHIMLSYNWEVQHIMLQLRDYLKQKYTIWMDVDKMKDSILSAMADAVENSAVIVVAMTDSYKHSNSCRTEAEYAYKREVPILPLLLQSGYVPDGWLGAMVGTKLYVNLSVAMFEEKFVEVKQQIDSLIVVSPEKIDPITSGSLQVAKRMQSVPLGNPSLGSFGRMTSVDHGSASLAIANLPCKQWSSQEVNKWFKNIGITAENGSFNECDGVVLCQLCKLLLRSPETYYSILRQELHFNFRDMLLFTDAVEALLFHNELN